MVIVDNTAPAVAYKKNLTKLKTTTATASPACNSWSTARMLARDETVPQHMDPVWRRGQAAMAAVGALGSFDPWILILHAETPSPTNGTRSRHNYDHVSKRRYPGRVAGEREGRRRRQQSRLTATTRGTEW
jgi:hypothetical protein